VARERRQRRGRDRLADDSDREQHQLPCITQRCNCTGAEQSTEPAAEPVVGGAERDPRDERERSREIAAQRRVAQIDPHSDAHFGHALDLEPGGAERARDRPHERPPREALGPDPRPEREAAGDDREVVDHGRERLRDEVPARHQRAAQHAARDEEDLRGQEDPREVAP
jgi:hypothetical protein